MKSFEPRQYEALSCQKKTCSYCNFHVFPMDFDFDKKLLVRRNCCFSGTRQACNTVTFVSCYPSSVFSQAIQEGDPEHWDICLAAFNQKHVLTGQHKGVRASRWLRHTVPYRSLRAGDRLGHEVFNLCLRDSMQLRCTEHLFLIIVAVCQEFRRSFIHFK